MSAGFYKALEDRHRGSRDLIKSRLRVYYPFVRPFLELDDNATAVDLGCGRGEWLEVIREIGLTRAVGVDVDEEMMAPAREQGLNIVTGDAVGYLQSLSDASQLVVSAFHLVEHLDFPDVQALFEEAYRVIAPGGLLILETPNPENLIVGTTNFYVDPTHKRPMPPPLLQFLAEHYGFARIKVVRLQGHQSTESFGQRAQLQDVLFGVSHDYAVVAQKKGLEDERLDAAFAAEFGVDLEAAAKEYDRLYAMEIDKLNARIRELEHAIAKEKLASTRISELERTVFELHAKAIATLTEECNRCSARVTMALKWLVNATAKGIKRTVRVLMRPCVRLVVAVPAFHRVTVLVARKLGIYNTLRAIRSRLGEQEPHSPSQGVSLTSVESTEIYFDLKTEVDRQRNRCV